MLANEIKKLIVNDDADIVYMIREEKNPENIPIGTRDRLLFGVWINDQFVWQDITPPSLDGGTQHKITMGRSFPMNKG